MQPISQDPLRQLSQAALIDEIDGLGNGEWTTLYEYRERSGVSCYYYTALVPPSDVRRALTHTSSELQIGQGRPGFSQSNEGGLEITTYHRFTVGDAEPLLHVRDFHEIKPRQFDLSEEFRLYHDLYHDRHNDVYIHIDDRANEAVVVEVTPVYTRVLTKYLRQYMAARQMALAFYFDHRARSDVNVEEAKVALTAKEVSADDRRYSFYVADITGGTFSRVIGKRIVLPPPQREAGVWPFSTGVRRFVDFIIGVDETGKEIVHTSNPDELANYFGANEDAPHYLTPVWFRRAVLAKYYDNPRKFSVEDGYLRCGSLWGLQIDNNLPNHVMVYLGDLGRDLDYDEQVYWRTFNVTPGDRKPSEANFRRSFLAQFADPTEPDLVFKQDYVHFQERWHHEFGWPLYRPLHDGDAHILPQLRVPLSESAGEFETQVLYLAKLLVDSLNDAKLVEQSGTGAADQKSIAKFESYLEARAYPHKARDCEFLRLLQRLRSMGAAHTKGSSFERLRQQVGLNQKTYQEVFRNLLSDATSMLSSLSTHFISSPTGPGADAVSC
jgi:hypothetical protein